MKLHKLLFIATGMALATGFTACDDEYEPKTELTGAQIYFAADDNGMAVSLSNGQTVVEVPIYRLKGDAAETVTVTLSNDQAGVFALNQDVTFAEGATESTVKLSIDFNSISPNIKYPFTLTIPEEASSNYAEASLSGTVEYAPWSAWTQFGTGTYYADLFFGDEYSDITVLWRQSLIDDSQVQFTFKDLFVDPDYDMPGIDLIIDGTKTADGYELTFEDTFTGYVNSTYGNTDIVELYHFGYSQYKGYSTFDPSTGLFTLCVGYHVSAGFFGRGFEYFQLDGYASYDIEMAEAGHYVAANGTDYQLVQYIFSDDVASIKYAAVSGSLTDSEVSTIAEGIIDGSVESLSATDKSGYMAFEFPETGVYTVVAVGFDAEGNAQVVESLAVSYIPVGSSTANVDDDPDWTTLGYCSYTDDILTGLASNLSPYTYDVKIQVSNTEDKFRLVNAYGPDGYGLSFTNATQNYFININVADPQGVYLEQDDQGVAPFSDAGNFYTNSLANYYMSEDGYSLDQVKAAGMTGSYEQGFITFPTKTLMAGLVEDGKLQFGYANLSGAFEVDMTQLAQSQVKKRTSLRTLQRTYGNPIAKTEVKTTKFLAKVSKSDITKHNRTTLRNGL
jgi:hypothetical protein